jgi:hypothetical protein
MKNLDLIAARTAQGIIQATQGQEAASVDNLVTKALGVLQENGVYAAMLYLYSRTSTDKSIAEQVRPRLVSLASELGLRPPEQRDASTILKFLTDTICNDLDRLLLVKQLWEQTLIYARYGAKARSAAEDKKS